MTKETLEQLKYSLGIEKAGLGLLTSKITWLEKQLSDAYIERSEYEDRIRELRFKIAKLKGVEQ